MPESLTPKQREVFDFLRKQVRQKGYPPSIREICDAVNLSSTSSVHAHLKTLEAKGYIYHSPSKNRCIEITNSDDTGIRKIIEVPVLGQITAGLPIFAAENIEETFPLAAEYAHNAEVFMLRVRGESMIDAGIYNRDLIIARKQSTANNGDIIVAIIEDLATVKYFYQESEFVRLQPANSAYEPIYTREVTILGKVIGLFRKF